LPGAPRRASEKSFGGDDQNRLDSFIVSVVRDFKRQSETEEHVLDLIVSRLSLIRKLSWREPEAAEVEYARTLPARESSL